MISDSRCIIFINGISRIIITRESIECKSTSIFISVATCNVSRNRKQNSSTHNCLNPHFNCSTLLFFLFLITSVISYLNIKIEQTGEKIKQSYLSFIDTRKCYQKRYLNFSLKIPLRSSKSKSDFRRVFHSLTSGDSPCNYRRSSRVDFWTHTGCRPSFRRAQKHLQAEVMVPALCTCVPLMSGGINSSKFHSSICNHPISR